MKIQNTPIEGLLIVHPTVYRDERGYFFESFNKKQFENSTGYKKEFVQDNQSLSQKNILRGMHFQNPPYSQAKLVRVIQGSVLDMVVDLRKNSSTYGQHFSLELTEKNLLSLFIPEGFAHGFLTLEDDTIFLYKCTEFYNKESEVTLMWNDKGLAMDWKLENPIISEKDKTGIPFTNFNSPF